LPRRAFARFSFLAKRRLPYKAHPLQHPNDSLRSRNRKHSISGLVIYRPSSRFFALPRRCRHRRTRRRDYRAVAGFHPSVRRLSRTLFQALGLAARFTGFGFCQLFRFLAFPRLRFRSRTRRRDSRAVSGFVLRLDAFRERLFKRSALRRVSPGSNFTGCFGFSRFPDCVSALGPKGAIPVLP